MKKIALLLTMLILTSINTFALKAEYGFSIENIYNTTEINTYESHNSKNYIYYDFDGSYIDGKSSSSTDIVSMKSNEKNFPMMGIYTIYNEFCSSKVEDSIACKLSFALSDSCILASTGIGLKSDNGNAFLLLKLKSQDENTFFGLGVDASAKIYENLNLGFGMSVYFPQTSQSKTLSSGDYEQSYYNHSYSTTRHDETSSMDFTFKIEYKIWQGDIKKYEKPKNSGFNSGFNQYDFEKR
jgi:hypothetical protein